MKRHYLGLEMIKNKSAALAALALALFFFNNHKRWDGKSEVK